MNAGCKKPGARRSVRPKLRCPACGEEMTPPVDFCPECGADPRLAFLKKKRPRRLWARVMLGAQICLLAAVFGLLYKHAPWRGDGPPAAPASAGLSPEAKREAISAAPANFQRLAEENPILLLPYIYVYRAKTSVERHQDQFQAQFDQIVELGLSRDIVAFQKATPAQRQKMLEELFEKTKAEGGRP